jgi:hypothetical protein
MLGFVDKRDSQINRCLIQNRISSRSDLESSAAWKSLYGVPQNRSQRHQQYDPQHCGIIATRP